MPRTRLHLRLRPARTEAGHTWLSLSGPLPSSMNRAEIGRLITALSQNTGEAVRVVLFAAAPESWRMAWLGALSDVPEDHLDLRVRRRVHRVEKQTEGDDGQLDLFGGSR